MSNLIDVNAYSQSALKQLNPFAYKNRVGRVRFIAQFTLITFFFFVATCLVFLGIDYIHQNERLPLICSVNLFRVTSFTSIIFYILTLICLIPIYVQRLRDVNSSPWLALLIFVPLINFFFTIVMMCVPGNLNANKYGVIPASNSLVVNILAGLFVIWGWFVVMIYIMVSLILSIMFVPVF